MRFHLAFILAATVGGTALAHGPQIQITFNPATWKIETREIISTDSAPTAISSLKRVYVMPMLPTGAEFFIRPDATPDPITTLPMHVSNPGFAYQYESFVPGTGWSHSGSATLPNLQGTTFSQSFTDGLKVWTGTTFVDPGPEQLQMDRGGTLAAPAALASTTDSAPFETLPLTAIGATASANPHHTIRYRLLGDGISSTAPGDDGVYLASLQISSSAAGVGASDPFYFVFFKNEDGHLGPEHNDLAEALQAAASLGFPSSLIQTYALVPEPAGVAGLVLAAAAVCRRRA